MVCHRRIYYARGAWSGINRAIASSAGVKKNEILNQKLAVVTETYSCRIQDWCTVNYHYCDNSSSTDHQHNFDNSDHVQVIIRDRGIGIPENIKNKIFDPFFTTKEVGKGTRLGLTVCYEIVQKHGGQISVNSSPEMETEFIVTIPVKTS